MICPSLRKACKVLGRMPSRDSDDPLFLARRAHGRGDQLGAIYWCARALAQHETSTSAEWSKRFRYWSDELRKLSGIYP